MYVRMYNQYVLIIICDDSHGIQTNSLHIRRAENQSGLTHKSSMGKCLNAQKSNSYIQN